MTLVQYSGKELEKQLFFLGFRVFEIILRKVSQCVCILLCFVLADVQYKWVVLCATRRRWRNGQKDSKNY